MSPVLPSMTRLGVDSQVCIWRPIGAGPSTVSAAVSSSYLTSHCSPPLDRLTDLTLLCSFGPSTRPSDGTAAEKLGQVGAGIKLAGDADVRWYARTYDYLIIDLEHGAHSELQVSEVCALGRMVDFAVLIRPVDSEYASIRRTIDFGPCGCLLPGVESAADLDRVRDGICLPPRGGLRHCRR